MPRSDGVIRCSITAGSMPVWRNRARAFREVPHSVVVVDRGVRGQALAVAGALTASEAGLVAERSNPVETISTDALLAQIMKDPEFQGRYFEALSKR